ncbi:MAG: TetR/AcrR family transcriptional regulator [Planctomycetota bacterium]|jgi:TetR/AcrR family transcriptional repressor of nem operon
MSRPRLFDPETVLDRAMEQFQAHGFEATSVQMLVDATGIERFSLYSAFGDKRGLFLAAMERYCGRNKERVLGPLQELEDGAAALERVMVEELPRMALAGEAGGCLVVHTMIEKGPHDEELLALVQAYQQRLHDALAAACRRMAEAGQLRPGLAPAAAAGLLQTVMQGLVVQARGGQDLRALRRTARTVLASLRTPSDPSHS